MSKKFICKAPWTSIAFQPTGIAPCCVFGLENLEDFSQDKNHFESTRKIFLNGDVPNGCQKCYSAFLEDRPGYWKAFENYSTDFKSINIQEINIKSNNLCNLACRSCGPHFSSKWEEEFNNKIVITKDNNIFDKLNIVDFKKIKHIRFAGGEPTLTGDHVRVLQHLIKIDNVGVDIALSTNLHSLRYKDVDLVNLWKQFPKLRLQLSIDGVEDRATSIRSGSDWELVCKNLKILQENKISHYVNITVSALNIWFLEETIEYLKNRLNISKIICEILSGPDILNMQVIPAEYRHNINTMLDRCEHKGYPVKDIKKYFNMCIRDELWNHFLIYNLILDSTRKETFFNDLPIRSQLINRWTKL